jgi:hypothetical protein
MTKWTNQVIKLLNKWGKYYNNIKVASKDHEETPEIAWLEYQITGELRKYAIWYYLINMKNG